MVRFDRLEGLIEEQGRKKSYLCEKAGKKRGYISDAQNGNGSISDEALAVFARELGTTVEYLTGLTDEPGTKKKPAVPKGDELVDAIIMSRDGKTIRRKYTKEQREALRILLDNMPFIEDEEL